MLYPENERISHFSDGARAVVSEPLIDLPGMGREVPAGTAVIIREDIQEHNFRPINQPPPDGLEPAIRRRGNAVISLA